MEGAIDDAARLQLGCQNKRRRAVRVDGARIGETGLAQPAADFFKGKCIAAIGVDQHVDAEDKAANRPRSIGVHQELGDGDGSTGGERVERFGKQRLAANRSFAVQDVTQRCNVVTAAKSACSRSPSE